MKERRGRLLVGLIAILIGMLIVPAVAIAGPGQNNGQGRGKTLPATLSVTPDPVAARGATYTVTGDGFNPGEIVYINEYRPYCCSAYNVLADSNGHVEFTRPSGWPGTYGIKALQKKNKRYKTMAFVTFEVVSS